MLVHKVYGLISPQFRRLRLRTFGRLMKPGPAKSILDVGGTDDFWAESDLKGQVTILNTEPSRLGDTTRVRAKIVGDGCTLPFPDQSFDIVFSNSVIEHVGSWERQIQFARESRRVGRSIWIQTPAREFFIEPHLIAPFIHWLPRSWQRRLIRGFTLRGWLDRPNPAAVERFLDEVRLISFEEMKQLFPGSVIIKERFFGLCKSYTAMNLAAVAPADAESTGKSGP